MNDEPPGVPPNGRLISAALATSAALALLVNHFLPDSTSVARLLLLALAPLGLFVGLGGIVEPNILWSVGKYGQHVPLKFKVIGGLLAALGVAVTLLLVFVVYPLGPRQPE